MEHEELLTTVRALRVRRFTSTEIARALGVSKADVARLVRVVACERESQATAAADGNANGDAVASRTRCWVSPGWRHGLRVDGHSDWPEGGDAPSEAGDSGVACVLVASPDGRDKLSVCGYLVDTWCLGVKNAIGPQRMGGRELDVFKRHYFGPWVSEGIPVPLELARHLVLGAVDYARSLGFEPHPDFRRAGRALGSWDSRSSITFGRMASRCTSTGLTTTHNECSRRSSALSAAAAFTTASLSATTTGSATATATPPR